MAYLFLAYNKKHKYRIFFIYFSHVICPNHSLSSFHCSQPHDPTLSLFPRSMAPLFPFQKMEVS